MAQRHLPAGLAAFAAAAVLAVFAASAGSGPAVAAASPAAPTSYTKALFLLDRPGGLYRLNRRVSDPVSPQYRRYRSVERLVDRFGATKGSRRATVRWLRSRGFRGVEVDPTRTFVTASVAGDRSRRSLALRGGDGGGQPSEGLAAARVPNALAGDVDAVSLSDGSDRLSHLGDSVGGDGSGQGGADSPQTSARRRTGTPAGCAEGQAAGFDGFYGFTPNQYLTAYGHQALHDRGIRGQGQRIAVIEIDGFARSDIEAFGECFGIRIPPLTVIPVGRKEPLAPGGETTLDLQVLAATAPAAKRIDVYEGGAQTFQIMKTIGAALGRRGHHPDVVSISLGGCEPGMTGQIAPWRGTNNLFALAGAAGISTLVASGDQGSTACKAQFGETSAALPLQSVSFPASSPFVTAVGGTNFSLDEQNSVLSEVTWNDREVLFGASGGGVSILSQRFPWWQRGKGFRDLGSSNRVLPDIAALADPVPGYAIHCVADECKSIPQDNPGWISIGGTSAATPLTAGGIALANQLSKRKGRAQLGFLNPLLYRYARRNHHRVFRDIRVGGNDLGEFIPEEAGGGEPIGCCAAKPGFDLATGLGSPKLLALAKRSARRQD